MMLNEISGYFSRHPVLSRYQDEVCIALTGSFAVGLGGRGADVDVKVLCPPDVYGAVKLSLVTAGRIRETDEPEEEFDTFVGDYTLESLPAVWAKVQAYHDMTPLFIYGNLVYLVGKRDLLDPLVSYCRHVPPAVLQREIERERTAMSQDLYGFLRSFQNGDAVARLLAHAGLIRAAMRLTFLAEGMAPPYDKHLFRLLPRAAHGQAVADLIQQFLGQSVDAIEAVAYAAVATTEDWHAMYAAATESPAVGFHNAVLRILNH
ncbi:MAG TPA: DUF4037 domain-containing protein [Symbiobacteriaceae bacterium]|nr:DUF4037 domain-containing protein [Symbiobacteriaceae bacterium]